VKPNPSLFSKWYITCCINHVMLHCICGCSG
jgi:hypothetical protein